MAQLKRHLKVFLCHDSGDEPRVREFYHRLMAGGADAWLKEEKLLPGQDSDVEISKAVRDADVVVIFLSSQSIPKEGHIQREIRIALDVAEEKPEGSIFIIPARLEVCIVPNRISRWQSVDLFNDDGYQRLIKALNLRAEDINVAVLKTKDETQPKVQLPVEPRKIKLN